MSGTYGGNPLPFQTFINSLLSQGFPLRDEFVPGDDGGGVSDVAADVFQAALLAVHQDNGANHIQPFRPRAFDGLDGRTAGGCHVVYDGNPVAGGQIAFDPCLLYTSDAADERG